MFQSEIKELELSDLIPKRASISALFDRVARVMQGWGGRKPTTTKSARYINHANQPAKQNLPIHIQF